MKKILVKLILSLSLIVVFGCGAPNREAYNIQWMKDNVTFVKHPNYEGKRSSNPLNKYLKGFNANSIKPVGETGCVMVATNTWKFGNYGSSYWSRQQSWEELDSPITSELTILLDSGKEDSSYYVVKSIEKDPTNSPIIYIGPWKYISKIDKEIRLVALQSRKYGGIRSFLESKTPENAKIPEMPEIKLARSPEMNLDYCRVLWVKTYGYNAVADLRKNPWWPWFSRNYYVGTGKIIEAKE